MLIFSLLAAAPVALGCAIVTRSVDAAESPLKVSLEMTGNTKVKAVLTNSGESTLKLFNSGTVLDPAPVDKVKVFSGDNEVDFEGIYLHVLRTGLDEDAFTTVGAKESVEVEFDVAQLYNLREGGEYTIHAEGAIPYAEVGSTDLSGGALGYSSNVLKTTVDGNEAAGIKLLSETFLEKLQKRDGQTTVSRDCTGTKDSATRAALVGCAKLAAVAAEAAVNGSVTKFKEYFKVDDAATRQKVSDRLTKVAAECNSGDALARLSCVDGASSCSSRVLAYTQPSTGYMVNCNLYFTALEAMPKRCHGQDQATTTLHEMTHVRAVYAPNTVDNAYGYAASSKLSSRQALLNANTFELFTSDTALNCSSPKSVTA